MKYKLELTTGDGYCEDCGLYEWYLMTLTDEEGVTVFSSEGDDHLDGMCIYHPENTARTIVQVLENLGHMVDFNYTIEPYVEDNYYDDIDDNLYDKREM